MFESEYEYLVNDQYRAIVDMEDNPNTIVIHWDDVPVSLRASAKTELFDLFDRIDIPSCASVRRYDNQTIIELSHFPNSVACRIDSQMVTTFVPIAQRILDGDWARPSQ